MKNRRRLLLTALGTSGCLLVSMLVATQAAAAAGQRVDMRVLVVTDHSPQVDAISQELVSEGLPFTTVDLAVTARTPISAAFLSDVVGGVPRAKFQSVVLPNQYGGYSGLGAAEMSALATFESTFGIRQVDAYNYPYTDIGLNSPWFAGTMDGDTAAVTPTGLAGAFSYLNGPIRFDDVDPAINESYGYLADPAPVSDTSTSYITLVQGRPSSLGTPSSLVGVYSHNGREELNLQFSYNYYSTPFRLLAHGLITWMTRGVHLGYSRNYFSTHIDDVFEPDSRWSAAHNCTPTNDCPAVDQQGQPITTPNIRMTAADEAYLKQWQTTNKFAVDLLFNGEGSVEAAAANGGSDTLTVALKKDKASFRWTNHTYSHDFLGCVQDFTVIPWRCVTDPLTGAVQYVSQADIASQITQNITFARSIGLAINRAEVVTGEHSGTRILPQQPQDNPNLAPALQQAGITSFGTDASREPGQRLVGPAYTVPRYPVNVFYNAATVADEIDEYNWIYTSAADGGSGYCTAHSDTTACIAPLTIAGYASYVVPTQAALVLRHVMTNDPRPHYAHQSNLAEDRILYPVLNSVLSQYRAAFATNTPFVQPTLSESALVFIHVNDWASFQTDFTRSFSAYTLNGKLFVSTTKGSAQVPITVPTGTRVSTVTGALFGNAYAGEQSDYGKINKNFAVTLVLGTPTV